LIWEHIVVIIEEDIQERFINKQKDNIIKLIQEVMLCCINFYNFILMVNIPIVIILVCYYFLIVSYLLGGHKYFPDINDTDKYFYLILTSEIIFFFDHKEKLSWSVKS